MLLPIYICLLELSDNNVSDDELSLLANVAVKQILEVILMLDKDVILMAYQINVRYNANAHDNAFYHINYVLHFVKSTLINDSLKEAIQLYCT